MTEYLSIEQVEALHRFQIARYGGGRGLRDRGLLEAAVARPRQTFGGEDRYPDLTAKAAALMHSLVTNHPFVDGNKRVGAHAALVFLLANGLEPTFSPSELTRLTFSIARDELEADVLAIWLRQRTRRRDP